MTKKGKKNINILLVSMLSIVIMLGIVYFAAGYAETAQNNENWNISITNIESTNIVGSATNVSEPTFEDKTASFNTNLVSPGDSITYKVTVQNKGKVDATLKTITMSDSNNPLITFATSGVQEGDVLQKGQTHILYVTVGFNESATTSVQTTTNTTITLDYEQTNPDDIVDIVITTTWQGDSESDRPDNIVLHLKSADKDYTTDNSKWTKQGNTWTYTFEDMFNQDYTIYEEDISNYTSPYMGESNAKAVSGTNVNITNTLKEVTPTTKTITITATWEDDNESDRPDTITAHLVGPNNEEYTTDNTKWIKNGNTWTYTFEVPEGNYKVYEEAIDGYTGNCVGKDNAIDVSGNSATITNTFIKTEEAQSITITATFDTDDRPDNIVVYLIGENNEYVTDHTKWIKNGDTWTYTFEVPKGEYTIYEEKLDNFTSNIMGKAKAIKVTGNIMINHKFIKTEEPIIKPDNKEKPNNSIIKIPNTLKNSIPWIVIAGLGLVLILLIFILRKNDKEDKNEKTK